MNDSFQMPPPFPHFISGAATGDLPPAAGSFTALLTADDDDLDFDIDQRPFLLPLPPPPETLESLIPPSILSGRSISPRKRALEHVQIPMLHSPDDFPQPVMPALKFPRLEVQAPFSPPALPTLDSIMTGFSLPDFVDALMASAPEIDDGAPTFSLKPADKGKKMRLKGKDRRRIISEKIWNLRELLPGARKMNTASLLDAAHAYIKFLQAQVQALSSMPAQSAYAVPPTASTSASGVVRLLGSLTRQQLLQVVVNSPAAPAVLSSEKCCVVSAEQVVQLKKMLYERLSGDVGGAWM